MPKNPEKNVALFRDIPALDAWRGSGKSIEERFAAINPRCTCGNPTRFVGIDPEGWGGPEVCDCGATGEDDDLCTCTTRLVQPFTITTNPNEPIDYGIYVGGGYDAEISDYKRIRCAECHQLLWQAPDDDNDQPHGQRGPFAVGCQCAICLGLMIGEG